jgi:transposase
MDNRKNVTPGVGSDVATVYAAIELSMKNWLVAVQSVRQERPGRHKLAAHDAMGLWAVIERERAALLAAGHAHVQVVTCYEAGRDGFWLHRFLVAHGAESQVVDPGSMLVNRRARRAKSDRLDVEGLLRLVIRHDAGDRYLGRMVVAPSVDEEDRRRPERERGRLLSERTAHNNRIKGLLATHGVYGYKPLRADRWARLAGLRCAGGAPLPAHLREEMARELERLDLVEAQIAALEKARRAALEGGSATADRVAEQVRRLMRFKGIELEGASGLAHEVLYRSFANRRAVAGYVGLGSSPFRSGAIDHDQGIAKAGNRRARSLLIQLAWQWVRHQPESAITRWYKAQLAAGKSRAKKRQLIVAVARQLLVALWRYVTTGGPPAGAAFKA